MRIDGVPPSPKAAQSNPRGDAARAKKAGTGGGDVVEISKDIQEAADLAAKAKATADANPRLNEIKSRVQSGFYNTREAQEKIADGLLKSNAMQEVVSDMTALQATKEKLAKTPDVRQEKVSQARQRVASKFFDTQQVRQQTADNMLDESV